jgi:tetratricopeptide (TPR) repeat protein
VKIGALSLFEEGEKLFMQNKPEEAKKVLEAALAEDSDNEKIYLYLGIIYEQLDNNEKAISIMEVGAKVAKEKKERFFFNMGNNYFSLGQKEKAEAMYSQAIEHNGGYAKAYLNRANTRLANEDYRGAVDDYTHYLSLRPSAPQKEKIERVIELLKQKIVEAEQKRREEELRRQEEERRKKEEARRKAEEERRRREEEKRRQEQLLQDVLNSIENASEDTSSMSADSEDIEDLDMELELQE